MATPPQIWVRLRRETVSFESLINCDRHLPYAWGTSDSTPDEIDRNDHGIGDHSDGGNKLAELAGTPRALEILPPIEDRRRVQNHSEDILLNKSGRDERPRVVVEERGNERKVGNDRGGLDAADGGVKLSPSGNVVEKGEGEQDDETNTGSRRDIDSERHFVSRARDRRLVGPCWQG